MQYTTILFFILILFIHNSIVIVAERPADYSSKEGLKGHGGVFAALDWSDYELSKISSLHASANYPEVMRLVKQKLITSEISLNDRRKIERALKTLRPPPVFDGFLDEEQVERVQKAHSESDVNGVLDVISERLHELPSHYRDQAVSYLTKHTPQNDLEF